jgi:hypothetical protein
MEDRAPVHTREIGQANPVSARTLDRQYGFTQIAGAQGADDQVVHRLGVSQDAEVIVQQRISLPSLKGC